MKRIKFYTVKFITLIIALQIFNLSIYTQDFIPIETHLTVGYFNEINSIMEYVAEIVLHHTNAFPEYGNSGTNDMQCHKHISITLFSTEPRNNGDYTATDNIVYAHYKPNYHYLFCKEINPPPPKSTI